MNLFDIIPENLFSILASKNRGIYLDALFVIHRAYKQELFIKKEHLVSMLISNLEDRMMDIELEEEEIIPERNLSSMAYFLVRKLKQEKWIDIEHFADSFEEHVILYDYSIKILNTLYELMNTETKEYNSLVYSTYATLKTAEMERDDYSYNALLQAHKNTNDLVDELRSLLNNIRRYHQFLNEQSQIREVLQGHFDQFKELIGDKIYYPLKTFDSVPRFKAPILRILKKWMYDSDIKEKMVESCIIRNSSISAGDALENIILMIGDIIDKYEKMDELIREIDKKNSAYTRASVEKMQYLLNTDRSIKGKLIEIIKITAEEDGVKKTRVQETMQGAVNVFSQGFIDEFSLYSRAQKKVRRVGEPLKVYAENDSEELVKEMNDLKERIKKSYTTKRIMQFMKRQFAGRDEIETKDFEITGDEDFVMLILGTLKHDESSAFYEIEFLQGYIYINGYRLPQMRLTKKVG